jgi:hypothetical protein
MAGRNGGRSLAQVVAVEQRSELRAFVSLDDLERLAAEDPASPTKILGQLRTAFESFEDRPSVVYVLARRG